MGPLFIPPSSKLAEDCTSSSPQEQKNSHSQDVISSKAKSWATNAKGNNLRKYVVIAQDCVAVKMSREPNCGARFNGSEVANDGYGIQDNGMALFKLFLQSNSKCHWNDTLVDSLNSLQYKGHITPNIILIYSSTRHLNTLRTAWSRRILREPPGYKLEMLGDVEEIFTQPIGQSQFAPLSDSLCWAIMHLCSNGMEAFVDSIIGTLGACFPGMEIPSKELVFQTLEKLIKEQKIYQTANGYFIVTPEVSSYIASSSGVSCCSPMPVACHHMDYELHHFDVIDRISHHSWGSVPSLDEPRSRNTLKRHNSLRVVSRRDEVIPRPHMGARSLSFRLSKRQSLLDEPDTTPTPELILVDTIDQGTQVDQPTETVAAKKRRSLFARLFSFKKPSPRPKEPSPKAPPQPPQPEQKISSSQSTCSTQTQASSSTYSRRRHSLVHIPDSAPSHYELLHHHHAPRSQSHGRSSSLSHHNRSRTRSRASSPCSNISNIYASLRCTPTAEYNTRSRRLSRASVHDLYRTSKVDKDGQLISTHHRSIESSDDVSH